MFERFTERARQVVVLAQQAARDADQDRIDSVALLLGLLGEAEGLAARALWALEVDEARVRAAWKPKNTIEEVPVARDEPPTSRLPFTFATKKILELALQEALSLGHNYIGTEHILLGLVRSDYKSYAAEILREEFDLGAQQVRDEVLSSLVGPRAPKGEPETDQKFRSFSHAWATGVIGAALVDAKAFSVIIDSRAPEMTVRIGSRSYRVIVEELQ